MPRVFISPRAKADLIEIWDYIAEDSEPRADAFVAKIHEKLFALSEHPGIGRAREELGSGIEAFQLGGTSFFIRRFGGHRDCPGASRFPRS